MNNADTWKFLQDAPVGTKAPAIMGGHWYKMSTGFWKWNGPDGTGGSFPRPGGDWTGELKYPEKSNVKN